MSDKEISSREGVNMVFSETNVTIMLWFVVIFLMLSSFMNLFRDNEFSFTIKLLDFVFLLYPSTNLDKSKLFIGKFTNLLFFSEPS